MAFSLTSFSFFFFFFYLNLVPPSRRAGSLSLSLSLSQGFFGAHLRLWMQLFPARQFIVVDSDKYFSDASPVEEEVLKFLRDEMGVPRQRRSLLQQRAGGNAGAKTCWHNCETKKRSYKQDVDGPLESQLRALYAPDALLLQDSQKYVRWVR
jgi:hypothetical protein